MGYKLNELGDVLLDQVSQIVLGGDQTAPANLNTFLTWCQPGIPFGPEQFDFATGGFGSGAEAKDNLAILNHAFNFAQLVDFIPDIKAAYTGDKQAARFNPNAEERLTTIYSEILQFSKVVHQELTDEQNKKLEKFRGLLRQTKKVKDIVTEEEKEVTEDGPMLKAYNEKLAAYIAAALNYNNKRIAAQSAAGAAGNAAVADFSTNAELYRLQVKAARDAWVAGGYRNEVDDINSYIDQVTRRDMVLWKQSLVELFNESVVNTPTQGQRFNYTTLLPGDFASAGGWTRYAVSHDLVDAKSHDESSQWQASAGLNLGFWSFGGNVHGASSEHTENLEVDNFMLSCELCQTVISRPWFYPEFFSNRGWDLKTGDGWMYDDMPSNGEPPPNTKGKFVGYPTTILWARNVQITSAQFASAYQSYSSEFGGGGSVGWGPFTLSGGGAHQESGTHLHAEADGQGLSVEGMQIIGFVNHLIGKAPNRLEQIKDEELV
jgi:hypothetical protein